MLPIGGLKQKLLAAQRAGLTEVFVPQRNAPDLDDVPADVLEALTVHLVSDVREVLERALEGGAAGVGAASSTRDEGVGSAGELGEQQRLGSGRRRRRRRAGGATRRASRRTASRCR